MGIMLRSNRTGKEYPVELYQKDDAVIVRHTSLEQIFWGIPDGERPKVSYEPWNIPYTFAVLLKMYKEDSGVCIQQIGEFTVDEWNSANPVSRNFPLTTCANRAFDRAFIRYMQFNINEYGIRTLYSSEEIMLDKTARIYQGQFHSNPANCPPQGNPANVTNCSPQANSRQATQAAYGGHSVDPRNTSNVRTNRTNSQSITTHPATGSDGAPNFPWMGKNPSQGQMVLPDTIQPEIPQYPGQNGIQGDLTPQQERSNKKRRVSVYRVTHDFSYGKTRVETDAGILFYDPFRNIWEGESLNPNEVDLDALYQSASEAVKQPLREYNGTIGTIM